MLFFLAAFLASRPLTAGEPASAALRSGPVFVIGIDGASWQFLDQLLAKGELPNIGRLAAAGCHASMTSLRGNKLNSPVIWTTIMTGKNYLQHGIESWPEATTYAASTIRRVKTLWNILSDRGRRVFISSMLASWPAEKVNGILITKEWLIWEKGFQTAFPSDLFGLPEETLIKRHLHDRMGVKDRGVPSYLEQSYREHLGSMLAQAFRMDETAVRSSELILAHQRFDLFVIHLWGLDWVSHFFYAFYDNRERPWATRTKVLERVILDYYRHLDSLVGRLLRYAPPNATILLLSDHGHAGGHLPLARKDRKWVASGGHVRQAVLIMAGPPIPACTARMNATVFDIAPTILYLLDLPIAKDMPGKILDPLIAKAYREEHPVKHISSYEAAPVHAKPELYPADPALLEKLRALGYLQ